MSVLVTDTLFTVTATSNSRNAVSSATQTIPKLIIPCDQYREIFIQIVLTNLVGTTPTIKFGLDSTIDGTNWTKLGLNTTATNTAGAILTFGLGCGAIGTAVGNFTLDTSYAAVPIPFGNSVALNWTATGTLPSFDFTVSAIGK